MHLAQPIQNLSTDLIRVGRQFVAEAQVVIVQRGESSTIGEGPSWGPKKTDHLITLDTVWRTSHRQFGGCEKVRGARWVGWGF